MELSTIMMLFSVAFITIAAMVYGDDKANKPDVKSQMVNWIISLFIRAFVVSECLSFALASHNIHVGYWQAFFAVLAIDFVGPIKHNRWTEWVAYKRAEKLLLDEEFEKVEDEIIAIWQAADGKTSALSDTELKIVQMYQSVEGRLERLPKTKFEILKLLLETAGKNKG